MRRFILICLGLLAIAPLAQAADWYQVEVYVFAQQHPNTSERPNYELLPHYNNQAIHPGASQADVQLPAIASQEVKLAVRRNAWNLLGKNNHYAVAAMASRMLRSGRYRTLYYGRWKQPMPKPGDVIPIYIQGGKVVPAPAPLTAPQPMRQNENAVSQPVDQAASNTVELQGTISLSKTRYVHFKTNLWFATQRGGQPFFTHIDEPRRLKDGEVNYLDNPYFGVIVEVNKL